MTVAEKWICVDPDHSLLSVSRQCGLIGFLVPAITGTSAVLPPKARRT